MSDEVEKKHEVKSILGLSTETDLEQAALLSAEWATA